MKTIIFIRKVMAILIMAICCCFSSKMTAQTIQIDSTFSSDGEIFPFSPNDTIYGLSISGHVTLSSDTSLVRVLLTDNSGNEWMVYEAYPMIVEDWGYDIDNVCDETCYLNGIIPNSLHIQVSNAIVRFDSFNINDESIYDIDSLIVANNHNKDSIKVEAIRSYINRYHMLWFAGSTKLSRLSYEEKKKQFGNKYNLSGYDYYAGGIFDPAPFIPQTRDDSPLVKDFDWRKKHNAHLAGHPYFDGDPDRYTILCNSHEHDIFYETGNGWMTSVKNQDPDVTDVEPYCLNACDGCCYIFGALGVMEAIANLYFNYHYDLNLSEQYALNCNYFGCDGGSSSEIFNLAKPGEGIIDDNSLPWQDGKQSCNKEIDFIYKLTITDWEGDGVSVPPETEDIKKKLIEKGPLKVTLDVTRYAAHDVVLVGYGIVNEGDLLYDQFGNSYPVPEGSDYIGSLYWIVKNSYGPTKGAGGYFYFINKSDAEWYYQIRDYAYIKSPINVEENNPFFDYKRHCYDYDNDGYYNWGLGDYDENLCNCLCIDHREDSNDDDDRIGYFDVNYNGTQIKPEFKVYELSNIQKHYIDSNSFFQFKASDLDEGKLHFFIENPGTAQLNLNPDGPVNISEPEGQERHFFVDKQPESKICMKEEPKEFDIKVDLTDPEGSYIATITINDLEHDIENFQFAIIYNGCETITGTDEQGTDQWDEQFKLVQKDVKILSGSILTVTGNVAFTPDADLIVERGGKLIINGGKLTNACDNQLWNGIQVWGYKDKSQFDLNFIPGIVEVSNKAVIENARTAIATIKKVNGVEDVNFTGGMVICNDASFINNIYSIKFCPYRNFNPNYPAYETENRSNIKKCNFETRGPLPDLTSYPIAFVRMDGVQGIHFNGNNYINSSEDSFNWIQRGIGIESYHSSYTVDELCLGVVIPCNNIRPSYFNNLYYGIRSFGQGQESKAISILNSEFDQNQNGIFISNSDDAQIVSNKFTVAKRSNSLERESYGLYIEQSTGYTIEENSFIDLYPGYYGNIGMYINNSGSEPNEVYKNDFSDLEYGIVAYGQNRSETGDGLCLVCNNFNLCTNDIHVIPEKDQNGRWLQGRNQGIAASQHNASSLRAPAGNTFTDRAVLPSTWNYFNHDYCNLIYYHHHQPYPFGVIIEPYPRSTEMITLMPEGIEYLDENQACPSNLGGGGINPGFEKSKVLSENEQATIYSDSIQTLKDGGDTYSLNLDVVTSTIDEAYQLRQQLLDESPYLSDTVMKSAIYKENVLPSAMLRDVLVANPQSAKSSELLDKIESRIDPMPDEMLNEILQGRNVEGNLEILEAKLAGHKAAKYKSLYKLESFYKRDTFDFQGSMDGLVDLWSQENDASILYKLAFLYLDMNDSLNCFSTLNSILQQDNMSPIELEEYEDFSVLLSLIWQLKGDNPRQDSLIELELGNLSTKETKPGSLARNILIANDLIDYCEPIYLADNLKSSIVIPEKTQNQILCEERLKIYPNPAKDYIIVSYDLSGLSGNFQVIVTSLEGKPLFQQKITGIKNQFIISTEKLSSTLYFIQLANDHTTIESKSFLITR